MHHLVRYVLLLLTLGLVACGAISSGGDSSKDPDTNPQKPVDPQELHYPNVDAEVFSVSCYRCHSHLFGVTRGGVALDSYAEASFNAARIYQAAIVEKRMPLGGMLTVRQYELLKAWLEAGAPAFEARVAPDALAD
ncbi:hypothetical protein [Bdellovibrio bacteriovorus]|uniref:hypothetical protein n=1 Tax=Bdellovibrio bacteriovorus TaxID=959 RepID=UPI000317B9FE|nr:hypothetical protein [Bdellovibrio bacteriovorus]